MTGSQDAPRNEPRPRYIDSTLTGDVGGDMSGSPDDHDALARDWEDAFWEAVRRFANGYLNMSESNRIADEALRAARDAGLVSVREVRDIAAALNQAHADGDWFAVGKQIARLACLPGGDKP